MSRFVNILLMLLVVIAFFFGVNTGKTIQKIDTPIKKEFEVQKVTVVPSVSLLRFALPECDFSFSAPSTLRVVISSRSATLTQGSRSLDLICGITRKTITASGSS